MRLPACSRTPSLLRCIMPAGLLLGALVVPALAQAPPIGPPSPPPPGQGGLEAEVAQVTAPVELDGRTLFRVRGVMSFPAEERARVISERIAVAARTPSIAPESVKAEPAEDVVNLTAGGRFLMAVTQPDARREGVELGMLARIHRERIEAALRAYREARSPTVLLQGARRALAATAVFAVILLVFVRAARRFEAWLTRRHEEKIGSVQFQSFEIVRAQRIRDALRWLLRVARAAAIAVVAYLWLQLVLDSFPVTRPLAERLLNLVLDPLMRLGSALLAQAPNLTFLLVLFVLVRWLLRLARLFFEAVEKGHVTLSGFEPEWASPTLRVVRMVVVAFALVVAYPYIPGSRTAAFQGLSIFLGVMLSIGSSSFIANIIAGYSMIYRRAFRVGDRILVGDVLGDVTEIRLQVTHLRSIKNEEIVVPNSTLLGSHVVNYSTLAGSRGLILHTTVGIGYETPWRQVEAMLLMAAARTEGLVREPPAYVLQKSLGDFCVVYELNVYCDAPTQMGLLYTRLHRSILDVFNEYEVQIMTPAYEGDPEVPKVVPKQRWWAAPARSPGPRPADGTGGDEA